MKKQEFYMQKCLELAYKGIGNVSPNPMVGSVIVYNNEIIGKGYHQQYGLSHAEANAIASVKNKELLSKSGANLLSRSSLLGSCRCMQTFSAIPSNSLSDSAGFTE